MNLFDIINEELLLKDPDIFLNVLWTKSSGSRHSRTFLSLSIRNRQLNVNATKSMCLFNSVDDTIYYYLCNWQSYHFWKSSSHNWLSQIGLPSYFRNVTKLIACAHCLIDCLYRKPWRDYWPYSIDKTNHIKVKNHTSNKSCSLGLNL